MNTEIRHKKLDVVMRYFLPVTAGIEINVWQTYRTLVKNGWDVTIHTTSDTYTERKSLKSEELIDGLKIRRYPFRLLGFRPAIDWSNTDGVCLHNFDIFPHFWIMLRVLYMKLTGKKGFSLFVTPHGGFSPEWSVFFFLQRIIKCAYTYTLGVFMINHAVDGIRAVSPWEAEEMKRHRIRKDLIEVITNGLEDEAYVDVESLASQDIKDIVRGFSQYVMDNSRLKSIKNVETIIESLAFLPEHIHFVHIGTTQNPGYRKRMLDLAKARNLTDRVHLLGVVRGIDKYYLYKHALAFVHPAIWEANANVVHEAWSQRLVTIVGDSTGMRAQVRDGENGFRVPVRDAKMLAEKVMRIADTENAETMDRMRDANMEYVRSHSWQAVGIRMGEFYLSRMPKRPELLSLDLVARIVSQKAPCIFVSPHLDDAILSAGGLISYLADKTEVKVINVFTKPSEGPYTFSTRRFLQKCGYSDAKELYKDRISEDQKVFAHLNIEPMYLDFVDGAWRKKPTRSFLARMFGRFIPEFDHAYPIHPLHLNSNKIAPSDQPLLDELVRKLEAIISKFPDAYVFCPVATDTHVDHVITRNVCAQIADRIIFWKDYPYRNTPKTDAGDTQFEWDKNLSNKIGLIEGYKSQLRPLFGNEDAKVESEKYYLSSGMLQSEDFPKPRVVVGIAAYNAEHRIAAILRSVVAQKEIGFRITKIIVHCDDCTDKTVLISEEFKKTVGDDRIVIIDNKTRKGFALSVVSMMHQTDEDIFVVLNDDIGIKDKFFLHKLVEPIIENQNIGLTSGYIKPLAPRTFIEKAIISTHNTYARMRKLMPDNNSQFTYDGASMALSRAFIRSLKVPDPVSDLGNFDAYAYFACKSNGFKYVFTENAVLYHRYASNLRDYLRQVVRNNTQAHMMRRQFGDIAREEYKKPKLLFLGCALVEFLKNPAGVAFMFFAGFYVRFKAKHDAERNTLIWDLVETSKEAV